MSKKYRIISSSNQIKIEGEYDQYNFSKMRTKVSQVISKFLRTKSNASVSIQETSYGLTKCFATVSIDFPVYEDA
jgi:hypothetical protein